jgi:hypothetical protein
MTEKLPRRTRNLRNRGPYSTRRLVELSRTWNFHSDADDLEDDNGEPSINRACRHLMEQLCCWRDAHGITDPWRSQETMRVRVSDVSLILDEFRRLARLEHDIIIAMGPPAIENRWNKRTGKHEPWEEV